MRLFLALKIEPSETYLSVINELKHSLRRDTISWADPNNAHLTLKFFGSTSDYRVDKIHRQMDEICQNIEPVKFSINKIGAFGSSYKPQILWFGLKEEEVLKQLHSKIMEAIKPIGYLPDAGNFVPHITFARIHKTVDKPWFWKCVEKHQKSNIQDVEIINIHLYESKLTPEKAVHSIIHTYQLSNTNT